MIIYLQEVGIIMKPIPFSIGLGSIFLLLACDYKNISNSNPQSSDLLHQEIQNYKKINKEKNNSLILFLYSLNLNILKMWAVMSFFG